MQHSWWSSLGADLMVVECGLGMGFRSHGHGGRAVAVRITAPFFLSLQEYMLGLCWVELGESNALLLDLKF